MGGVKVSTGQEMPEWRAEVVRWPRKKPGNNNELPILWQWLLNKQPASPEFVCGEGVRRKIAGCAVSGVWGLADEEYTLGSLTQDPVCRGLWRLNSNWQTTHVDALVEMTQDGGSIPPASIIYLKDSSSSDISITIGLSCTWYATLDKPNFLLDFSSLLEYICLIVKLPFLPEV